MSFCFDVKQEICSQEEKHKRAMFYGMILYADHISDRIQITTENVFVVNLLEQLAAELYDVHFLVDENMSAYVATLQGESFSTVCAALELDPTEPHFIPKMVEKTGQLAAFLKGAFLVGGYISNPRSAYHLELVCHQYQVNKEIGSHLRNVDFSFKSVVRKSRFVLYLKDSVVMERLLYVLGAKKAAFSLVDAKIYKQIKNENNRINNCAGYNQEKTLDKAISQLLAIQKIEETVGLVSLPEDLQEVAQLRKSNKMASLADLCRLTEGKFSKAGLSRRLSKIIEIANKIEK